MKNILVATDLSERSDRAVDRAALIAKQMNAMLHIVYVVDDEVTSTIALACEENATLELQRQIKEGPLFQGVQTSIHVEFGHTWKMITKLAEEQEVDLVVLGTHRNRGIRDLFTGTTLHRIARTCPAPFLIAAERATHAYANVFVGVDFSDCARNATQIAARIAPGQPLTLVHAYHIPFKALTMHVDEHGDIAIRERRRIEAEIDEQMTRFIASLENVQPAPNFIVKEGGAVPVLQAEVTAGKADLVCIGSHSKPWLVEALLGNNAMEVMSHPPCDVLVAPLR
ncbi:universal stress protein [Roseobacter sp. YSTF-M11]|uniref:Universal stress protein n=1 Tax=Roseobacter insulae TaxID=2859783 RepID=A0A9X1FWA7_9RHOB|nr:universal stress protein [Roseobacter insulae]MBW4708068.1 universal stress protein [Roseobacter insulae]